MLNSKFISAGLFVSFLVATFSVSNLEAAKVYTWKDATGTTHYSDKPFPQAKNSKEITVKTARPKSSDEASESEGSKRELFDAADSKRLNAECAKARSNLVTLASGKTIRSTNAEGEDVTLDEAALQAEVQKNQSFINSYCQTNQNNSSSQPEDDSDDS